MCFTHNPLLQSTQPQPVQTSDRAGTMAMRQQYLGDLQAWHDGGAQGPAPINPMVAINRQFVADRVAYSQGNKANLGGGQAIVVPAGALSGSLGSFSGGQGGRVPGTGNGSVRTVADRPAANIGGGARPTARTGGGGRGGR